MFALPTDRIRWLLRVPMAILAIGTVLRAVSVVIMALPLATISGTDSSNTGFVSNILVLTAFGVIILHDICFYLEIDMIFSRIGEGLG